MRVFTTCSGCVCGPIHPGTVRTVQAWPIPVLHSINSRAVNKLSRSPLHPVVYFGEVAIGPACSTVASRVRTGSKQRGSRRCRGTDNQVEQCGPLLCVLMAAAGWLWICASAALAATLAMCVDELLAGPVDTSPAASGVMREVSDPSALLVWLMLSGVQPTKFAGAHEYSHWCMWHKGQHEPMPRSRLLGRAVKLS